MSGIIRCVTTCHKTGWDMFGERMVRSFLKHWPSDIKLTFYAEDFEPQIDGLEVRQMPTWLKRFKEKNGDHITRNGRTSRGYDFRFDAVKFSHKVAALTDFTAGHKEGIDVWVDADTFTHSDVTHQWLNGLMPDPRAYMAWLERHRSFPECGFVMYRTSDPYHAKLMNKFETLYTGGRLFNEMAEWHDSFILQQLVLTAVKNGEILHPTSLSGDMGWSHPFVNGPLGEKMDHMKGPHRKTLGRSLSTDIRGGRRSEEYWRRSK